MLARMPQGGVPPGLLVPTSFRTLKRLGWCSAKASRADTADEVRLALAKGLCRGDRAVAQEDFATTVGNREWLRVGRQPVAGEHMAVSARQQIRRPRSQVGVAP